MALRDDLIPVLKRGVIYIACFALSTFAVVWLDRVNAGADAGVLATWLRLSQYSVAAIILLILLDAVLTLSGKPRWSRAPLAAAAAMGVVNLLFLAAYPLVG